VASDKAQITVARRSRGDIGQREVFIALDGKEFAILRYGDSVTRDVEPGPHLLRAHNTLLWKKVTLDVRPGEHVRFRTINRAGWGTYGIASVLGAGPIYLTFEQESEPAPDGAIPVE
jgi:hypothetical protein